MLNEFLKHFMAEFFNRFLKLFVRDSSRFFGKIRKPKKLQEKSVESRGNSRRNSVSKGVTGESTEKVCK